MKLANAKNAIAEAKRFIERTEQLIELHNEVPTRSVRETISQFPKEQGSVKRASLDLTRALADLRKPD